MIKVQSIANPGSRIFAAVRNDTLRGGALIVIAAFAGDEISIVDPEGLQCCHVAAFDPKGKCCTSQFSSFTACNASALAGMLETDSNGARRIRSKLKDFFVEKNRPVN